MLVREESPKETMRIRIGTAGIQKPRKNRRFVVLSANVPLHQRDICSKRVTHGELKIVQRTRCTRGFTENTERFASRCFLFLCPFSRCFRRAASSHQCLCFEPAHSGSERNPPRLHSHPEYLSPKLSLSLVNTTHGLTEIC